MSDVGEKVGTDRSRHKKPQRRSQIDDNEIFCQPTFTLFLSLPSLIAIHHHLPTTTSINQNHVRSSPTRNQHRHHVARSTQLPQTATTKPSRITLRPIQRIQRRQRPSQPRQRITRHHPHRWRGRSRNHDPAH